MEKENYKVYMHIFPNGKKYIGITCRKVKERWMNGKGYKCQRILNRSIEKYGWENIEHVIICEGLTKTEACEKEKELIKKYDTTNIEKGYNISHGGEDGCVGIKRTEEQRNFLKKRCRDCSGEKVVNLIYDEFWKLRTVKHYNSIGQASEESGVPKNTIYSKCKKQTDREWFYFSDYYIIQILKELPGSEAQLYMFLLTHDYDCTDEFVEMMGGNIEIWKKITKFSKKFKMSSESLVELYV